MRHIHRFVLLALAQFVVLMSAYANEPDIGYIYPAGGKVGTTLEVKIGGQRLKAATQVHVTGTGITAKVIQYIEPEWRTFGRLRRERDKIIAEIEAKKKQGLKVDHIEIPRRPRRRRDPKQQPNAQIEDTVRIRLTLAANAAPGPREIRLMSPRGASNPVTFHVGYLDEIKELPRPRSPRAPSVPTKIHSLPTCINGQILPGEIDRFRFQAEKGQRLVFITQARALIPYLADAVPGWFQAVVALHDENGTEVAFVDDYRFMPDPVLLYDVPKTGTYELRIRDSIYRGREDFVYRIAAGELPFVTDIFPLGGRKGTPTTVHVNGTHLSSRTVRLPTDKPRAGTFLMFVGAGDLVSNPLRYAVDTLPEIMEQPTASTPQLLTLPCIVNGRIHEPGDRDVFSVRGTKGDEIVAEVVARRLQSPLDSVLTVTDTTGKVLATNDDHVDRSAGLITHHADAYVHCVLPATGTYHIEVADIQNRGSRAHAYRLRVSPRTPDFALRTVPSSVTIPKGGSAPITVHVLRRDGFADDVRLSIKGADGVLSLSGVIPGNVDRAPMTITAAPNARLGRISPRLVGQARINNTQITRTAVPAEDMMQAFLWRYLVRAREWVVTVRRPDRVMLIPELAKHERLKIPDGGSVELMIGIKARGRAPKGSMKLTLDNPPHGISMEPVTVTGKDKKVRLVINGDGDVSVGTRGNLIITGLAGKRSDIVCMAPAIPFEIVE